MPPEGIPLKPVLEILTYDELIRTVRVAVSLGVRKVRITGGEPLVRRGVPVKSSVKKNRPKPSAGNPRNEKGAAR